MALLVLADCFPVKLKVFIRNPGVKNVHEVLIDFLIHFLNAHM